MSTFLHPSQSCMCFGGLDLDATLQSRASFKFLDSDQLASDNSTKSLTVPLSFLFRKHFIMAWGHGESGVNQEHSHIHLRAT